MPGQMRASLFLLVALSIFAGTNAFAESQAPSEGAAPCSRQEFLFDQGWRFHRGGAQGAQEIFFDDTAWRTLDLPHDWSIEDLPGTGSPFSRDAISQVSGGFTTGGTGWYRKAFVVPSEKKGNLIVVRFDGVYMNPEVWLNGVSLGSHPYGYTPFSFDVTDKIHFGTTNLLAVKVKNEGENSRWYSGSGIYRHVWLQILNPVHIAQGGVYITTPEISTASAEVQVQTRVQNQNAAPSSISLVTRIFNGQGKEVAHSSATQTISAGVPSELHQKMEIQTPSLWTVESPNLYTNVTEIYVDNQMADRMETHFGIRSLKVDATYGFVLNGEAIKLKGGCLHHDNGPLGAKSYDRAEERKVEILKASGYNTVRCAHNPPSPAFLDACDRLGMLVIDEAFDMWETGKNSDDYHLYFKEWWEKDITSMVERDRNHPSVVLWSIGNEIPSREKQEVVAVAKMLSQAVRKLDATRPVTSAGNELNENKDPFFSELDVAGYNYTVGGDHGKANLYELDHKRVPGRVMMCTESYPLMAFGSWMEVLDHPYVIGDFVWTAWDYIGEASIGWRGYMQYQNFYPWNLAFCGDIDICGWKRSQSFYRDTLWMKDQVSIFVKPPQPSFELNAKRKDWSKWHFNDLLADWTWPGQEGNAFDITVYSSCEEVELFLNGKSLGRKPTNRSTKFLTNWKVDYQPGDLTAVGYNGGQKVNSAELHSAATPSKIKLEADRTELRATGEDLSYITVELVDNQGVCNPKAEDLVNFEIEGPGTIVGVGNANPVSLESYQLPQRKAWHGRCLVVVKSGKAPGTIILKAASKKLAATELKLTVSP